MKKLIQFSIFLILISTTGFSQRSPGKNKTGQVDREEKRDPPVRILAPPRDIQPVNDRERPQGHPQRNPVIEEHHPPQRIEEHHPSPRIRPTVEPPVYNPEVYIHEDSYNDLPQNYDCECTRPIFEISLDVEIEPVKSSKILGIENFENKNYMEALQNFWDALIQNPDDSVLYYYRGCTNVKLGNYLWAIEDLDCYLHEGDKNYFISDSLKAKKAYYYRGLAKYYYKDKDGAYQDFTTSAQFRDLEAKIFLKRYY